MDGHAAVALLHTSDMNRFCHIVVGLWIAFAATTPQKPPPRMRTFFLSMRNSRKKRPAGESVAFRRVKKFSFSSVCLRRSLNKFVGCLVPVRDELDTLSASAGSD